MGLQNAKKLFDNIQIYEVETSLCNNVGELLPNCVFINVLFRVLKIQKLVKLATGIL